jgi:electron transport complex protein RnfB
MTTLPTPQFQPDSPYRRLARSLDALPNRFPPAEDESDLRLLAKIFTPEEADLAADLLPEIESPAQISARLQRSPQEIIPLLKQMSQKGLISVGKNAEDRLGFGLMPFVVGIYEAQIERLDAEMARLFEDYYKKAFTRALQVKPQVHRVVPVGESIKNDLEVQPFESVTHLIDQAQSWGVMNCICRLQKALVGEPCQHPVDVCMVLSSKPEAFSPGGTVKPLTREGAIQTLKRAAQAGLVHCVSNNQRDIYYICNCCTCSCGVLRGMADLGIANVVARSAFVNQVDEALCLACGDCISACQFEALTLEDTAQVLEIRCVGCGVCVEVCPQGALGLVRRDSEEVLPPETEADWRAARSSVSG